MLGSQQLQIQLLASVRQRHDRGFGAFCGNKDANIQPLEQAATHRRRGALPLPVSPFAPHPSLFSGSLCEFSFSPEFSDPRWEKDPGRAGAAPQNVPPR